jgi:hypothetical protein
MASKKCQNPTSKAHDASTTTWSLAVSVMKQS